MNRLTRELHRRITAADKAAAEGERLAAGVGAISDRATCNLADGTLCAAMDTYAEDGLGRKGLRILHTITDGKPRRAFVAYARTARSEPVVLNVCPWCEAPLRARDGEPSQ